MPPYYPIFLDVRDRKCVIIGGNGEAERKARSLLDCEAQLTLISPQLTPGLQELYQQGHITWHQRMFNTGDLMGAFLAIVADTDDSQVNRTVSKEAKELNVVLNVMDVTPLCTFIAPAVLKRGEVTVAISTGGASPALARKFREELSSNSIMGYADLAPILSWARGELRRKRVTVDPDHWQKCLSDDLLSIVQQGKQEEAMEKLMNDLLRGNLQEAADP